MKHEINVGAIQQIAPPMTALQFCRFVVSLRENISLDRVQIREGQGTRTLYIHILSEFLQESQESIHRYWGAGHTFPKMPKEKKYQLGLIAYALRSKVKNNPTERSFKNDSVPGEYMSSLTRRDGSLVGRTSR